MPFLHTNIFLKGLAMVRKYKLEFVFIAIVVLIITMFFVGKFAIVLDDEPVEEFHMPEPRMAWGFTVDSITIDTAKVRNNQSLSDILRPKGVSAQAIDRISRNSKDIFDLRRIRAGNNYYLIDTDSANIPKYMVYEESRVNYIVFDLDSQMVYRGQKEVDTLLQVAGGTIKSSLWNAFVETGAPPVLAVELSDIFAWTIDFFGIQREDEFRVIYDALFIDGEYAGLGRIHAATFKHAGTLISAYYYNNNEQEGYFDDEGNSLRKAFLKAPLKFSRISSHFSHSRMHPVLKIRRAHHGVDYAAPTGTPVYSIGDGTVVKKGFQAGGGGNYINIKHNSVYTSQYMHFSRFGPGMAVGVRVKQGQLIGYVGATGLASGPHLDFRIFKNGSPVDPLRIEAPPVEPISDINREAFDLLRDSLKSQLNFIKTMQQLPLVQQ
jgi:murein DD-endopeptidase MepM/ murein hydrolase activator NlpD